MELDICVSGLLPLTAFQFPPSSFQHQNNSHHMNLWLCVYKLNGRSHGGLAPGSPFLLTGARVAGRAAWDEVMEEVSSALKP